MFFQDCPSSGLPHRLLDVGNLSLCRGCRGWENLTQLGIQEATPNMALQSPGSLISKEDLGRTLGPLQGTHYQ